MTERTSAERDDPVERLQTATEALGPPMDDLTNQVAELAERMSELADGLSTFEGTEERLRRVAADGAGAAGEPRAAADQTL